MQRPILEAIEKGIKEGREIHLIRVLPTKSGPSNRILVDDTNETNNFPGLINSIASALKTIRDEMTGSRSVTNVVSINTESGVVSEVISEVVRPKRRLVVFGAGHVGQSVGLMGSLLGFNVVVVDDRPEFASRNRFPDARIKLIVDDYSSVVARLNISRGTAVVIVTRGHQFDEVCLRGTVRSEVDYLGMIGSKRRVLSIISKLEREGYSKADFEKLHAPIGLRIGAGTPQEIAVAILAEIISYLNSRNIK